MEENQIKTQEELKELIRSIVKEVFITYSDELAEQTTKKMEAKLLQNIGKIFLQKFFYLLGAVVVGLYLLLANKGIIKIG